jgi:hypothetical protein
MKFFNVKIIYHLEIDDRIKKFTEHHLVLDETITSAEASVVSKLQKYYDDFKVVSISETKIVSVMTPENEIRSVI